MTIFLIGFRASGKSTLANQFVTKNPLYKLVEMDDLIKSMAGKTITELTQNGTKWQEFRTIETQILLEIAQNSTSQNMIVSCGGGVGVNDIKIESTGPFSTKLLGFYNKNVSDTFGELQEKIIKSTPYSKTIWLNVDKKIIAERLKKDYEKNVNHRPNLQQNQKLDGFIKDENNQGISRRVESDLKVFEGRVKIYQKLADITLESNDLIDLAAAISV